MIKGFSISTGLFTGLTLTQFAPEIGQMVTAILSYFLIDFIDKKRKKKKQK